MKKVKKPIARVVTRITEGETRIMHKLFENGKMPSDVSQTLGRDLSTVARHYTRWENEEEAPVLGRPPALSGKQEEQVAKTTESMIKVADAEWQVTAGMVSSSTVMASTQGRCGASRGPFPAAFYPLLDHAPGVATRDRGWGSWRPLASWSIGSLCWSDSARATPQHGGAVACLA